MGWNYDEVGGGVWGGYVRRLEDGADAREQDMLAMRYTCRRHGTGPRDFTRPEYLAHMLEQHGVDLRRGDELDPERDL